MKNSLYKSLLVIGSLLLSLNAQSQFLKNIGKKLEQKAEQMVDKAIEGSGSKEQEAKPTSGSQSSNAGPFKNIPVLKYDFVRGSDSIFFDDFRTEVIGQMASRWTSNGTGAIEEPSGVQGKWLRLFDANTYKIKDLIRIPESYTLEFDLLTFAETAKDFRVDFGFDHQKGIGSHYYLADQNPVNIRASYRFNHFEFTSNEVSPRKKSKIDANMSYFVNDIMKVKIRVDKDRMSAYINEYKVLDTEMIDPMTKKYFYIAVENDKNHAGIYISNVRINNL